MGGLQDPARQDPGRDRSQIEIFIEYAFRFAERIGVPAAIALMMLYRLEQRLIELTTAVTAFSITLGRHIGK
jgi:hypothetical protein